MTDDKLRSEVRRLMKANTKTGYSNLLHARYSYVQPSRPKYPFQWFWDTFFHVYILCALGEYEMAKQNLSSLFLMQEKNGFVGHMIFWERLLPPTIWQILEARPTLRHIRPHMSALIQPTLAAQALERVYEDTKDETFLSEMLPKVKRYHEWLIKNRTHRPDGLVFIISPFESGIDAKPSYDHVLGSHPRSGTFRQYLELMRVDGMNFLRRYDVERIYEAGVFIVKDVCVNTLYASDLAALGRLCESSSDPDAARFRRFEARVTASILKLMYDEADAAFYDLRGSQNEKMKALTFTIFLPVLLPGIPDALARKVIDRHFFDPNEFALPYPVPSLARSSEVFNPEEAASSCFDYLWRGPTWPVINWLLYRCLAKRGFPEAADNLLRSTRRLIEQSGFREYYNPLTGEGYGAKHFTWAGLIVDMMREG